MTRFLPFALAGGLGFLVDAGVLFISIDSLGLIGGRLLSFACAVLTTWLINRRFAFADCATVVGKRYELMRYVLAMAPGGLVNWAVYGLAMTMLPAADVRPLLSVGLGSVIAMLANLAAAQTFVFRTVRAAR